jgi:hypothetical protein
MKFIPQIPLRKAAVLGFVLTGLVFSSGCSPDQPNSLPTEPLPGTPVITGIQDSPLTSTPTEQLKITPTAGDEKPPEQESPQEIEYDLNVSLDYFNHQLQINQKILVPHPGIQELDQITLVVPPNAWPNAILIQGIKDGGDEITNYQLDGVRLSIPLNQLWLPGEVLALTLDYSLNLPVQNAREGFGPSPFGYTTLQTNLVDWYPMVPPYQEEEGWVIHDPWTFGEYLVYPAANFRVVLEITNNPELVVAASSIARKDGSIQFYALDHARNFVFSISPDYQVLEGEVDGVKVYGYVFPSYSIPGQAAFDTTLEALDYYSELFGPFNQPSLSMIQADFYHGMEYEGLYFQSRGFFDTYEGTQESYLITIAAHETAHQWWYGQVANDQALEPWLDEAFCTFSELVYYEKFYPESVDWWWGTRVNFFDPEGPIDGAIYDFADPGGDNYENYRQSIYLRGAQFQHRLRETMGREAFYSFLQEYAERYNNKIVSREDFFTLLEKYIDPGSLEWLGEFFQE